MHKDTFFKAVVAGVLIGLGCVVNSRVGGIPGALLFATGLVTIIEFRLPLFTGIVAEKYTWDTLAAFLGNVIGAYAAHFVWSIDMPQCSSDILHVFLGGLGTGILMVAAYRSKSKVVAVMGVALFILSGFPHCIAEAGYARMSALQWIASIAGNMAGGQIWRFVKPAKTNELINKENTER